MIKNLFSTLFLSLLAVVTVACGDAGGAPIEGEGDLGEVLAGDENADDNDVNVDEEQNEDDANVEEENRCWLRPFREQPDKEGCKPEVVNSPCGRYQKEKEWRSS